MEYRRKEYFEITWASLRSMVEPSFAKRSVIDHNEYLRNARIISSPAVDITSSEVLTAQGRLIAYDYLVVATGHMEDGPVTTQEKLNYYQTGNDLDNMPFVWTKYLYVQAFKSSKHNLAIT